MLEEVDEGHLIKTREWMYHKSTHEVIVGSFGTRWWRRWDRRIVPLVGNYRISDRSSVIGHRMEKVRVLYKN
jgi:hypothetical protein